MKKAITIPCLPFEWDLFLPAVNDTIEEWMDKKYPTIKQELILAEPTDYYITPDDTIYIIHKNRISRDDNYWSKTNSWVTSLHISNEEFNLDFGNSVINIPDLNKK